MLFEVLANGVHENKEVLFIFDNFLLIVSLTISQASPSYGEFFSFRHSSALVIFIDIYIREIFQKFGSFRQ